MKFLYLDRTAINEFPNSISCLEALQGLYLGCSKFEKFPEIPKRTLGRLERLYLNGTAIKELPKSIGHLTKLKSLYLENCKNLNGIPSSICGLKNLALLSLNGCSDVEAFPEILVDMEELGHLYASGMTIAELPSSIGRLKNLVKLELINCENLVILPDIIGNLTYLSCLRLHNCPKLRKFPYNLRSLQCCLEELDLGGCNLMEGTIPSDLWCISLLPSFDVSENNIHCVPSGIFQLPMLWELRVNHCMMLEEIPEHPSRLNRIEAHGCPSLETLSSHVLWSSFLDNFKLDTEV